MSEEVKEEEKKEQQLYNCSECEGEGRAKKTIQNHVSLTRCGGHPVESVDRDRSKFTESHFPESHFPESHIPESHFPESHFPESHSYQSHYLV